MFKAVESDGFALVCAMCALCVRMPHVSQVGLLTAGSKSWESYVPMRCSRSRSSEVCCAHALDPQLTMVFTAAGLRTTAAQHELLRVPMAACLSTCTTLSHTALLCRGSIDDRKGKVILSF